MTEVIDWEIRRRRWWPFAPYDVYALVGRVSVTGGYPSQWERFAGGFWTRQGAQRWLWEERERMEKVVERL